MLVFLYEAQESIPKEPVPPGCVAWRAGTTTLYLLGYLPHRVFKKSSTGDPMKGL